MFKDCCKLIEYPAEGIHREADFQCGYTTCLSFGHECKIERQKDDELDDFQDIPRPRYDQTVLIQQRRIPRVIQRYWLLLVSIRDQVQETGRTVDNPSLIDGVHTTLMSALMPTESVRLRSHNLHFLA